jgi:hypothetical protein
MMAVFGLMIKPESPSHTGAYLFSICRLLVISLCHQKAIGM